MPAWLLQSLVALLLFGLWAVVPRAIGEALSPLQQQALSTVGLLPVLAMLAIPVARGPRRAGSARAGRGLALALLAGVLSAAGNASYYRAVAEAGALSIAAALTALYPLATVLLAAVFLRERQSVVQAGGIALALLAMWLFNGSEGAPFGEGGLTAALAAIALWGGSSVLQKAATNHVAPGHAALAFLGVFVPIAIGILIVDPLPAMPPARIWVLAILLGAFFGLGNASLLAAYGSAGKASIVTPLSGLYWIVAVPLGLVGFGDRVAPRQWAAMAITVVAVLALSRERKEAVP